MYQVLFFPPRAKEAKKQKIIIIIIISITPDLRLTTLGRKLFEIIPKLRKGQCILRTEKLPPLPQAVFRPSPPPPRQLQIRLV